MPMQYQYIGGYKAKARNWYVDYEFDFSGIRSDIRDKIHSIPIENDMIRSLLICGFTFIFTLLICLSITILVL